MILIITNKDDLTVDYFISQIEVKECSFFRFNTENFLNEYDFKFNLSDDNQEWCITNRINQKQISSKSLTGIWYRRPKLPKLPFNKKTDKMKYDLMIEARHFYDDFFKTIETTWVSHPDSISISENKMLQLKVAKQVGFKVPETILTNKPLSAKEFCSIDEQISSKPLRKGSYTYENNHYIVYNNILNDDDKSKFDLLKNFPIQLQVYIEKKYEIRVIVINKTVFAIKIDSQNKERTSQDWRVDNCHNVHYEVISLPKHIEKKCITLVKKFDLNFSSMDLILSVDNEYYFLDLNPNGQWGWLDIELNLKISDTLYDFLSGVKDA